MVSNISWGCDSKTPASRLPAGPYTGSHGMVHDILDKSHSNASFLPSSCQLSKQKCSSKTVNPMRLFLPHRPAWQFSKKKGGAVHSECIWETAVRISTLLPNHITLPGVEYSGSHGSGVGFLRKTETEEPPPGSQRLSAWPWDQMDKSMLISHEQIRPCPHSYISTLSIL